MSGGMLEVLGFLTPRSSVGADVALLVSVTAAAMLTAGVLFARRGDYTTHRWLQSVAVLLSAAVVVSWMMVSLARFILPGLPASLSKHGHTLAAAHAVVGVAAFALGMVLLVRGNQLMARRASLRRYRTPMRVAYLLYLAALALGITLYVVTYG